MADTVNISNLGPASKDLVRPDDAKEKEAEAIKKLEFKGDISKRKPSFSERLKTTFIAEDARDVGDYIIWDILIPTVKRTLNDVICGASNRIFLGSTTPQTSHLYQERGGVTRVIGSENRYSSLARSSSQKTETRPLPNRRSANMPRSNFNIDIFESTDYGDCAMLLDDIVDYLETKKKITVSGYYSLAFNSQAPYTSENWGWYSLKSASIERDANGKWFIKLPRPEYLE